MRHTSNPVLVTGSHRSGTTWIGKILALAPNTAYLHEPFNPALKFSLVEKPFNHWFQYICEDNAVMYRQRLDKVLSYNYPFAQNLKQVRSARNLANVFRGQSSALSNIIKSNTPILKDPIAFFSSEWLSAAYRMNVLITIRHPAAFCSSLKIKNWSFDFNHFLGQPLLMQNYLSKYHDEIQRFALEDECIIQQGILLWNCIHHTVKIYQRRHPEWLYVRHEDLSREPVSAFKAIYSQLGLKFTAKVNTGIFESSGAHNPKEQSCVNEFKRNSSANILNWKTRLTCDEIDLIRLGTHSNSLSFYKDSDW